VKKTKIQFYFYRNTTLPVCMTWYCQYILHIIPGECKSVIADFKLCGEHIAVPEAGQNLDNFSAVSTV
jgi:hypothetical protein